MEFGLGFLRWTEPEFWDVSLRAWDCAVRGFLKSKGIGPRDRGMSRKRLEELKAQYPDN